MSFGFGNMGILGILNDSHFRSTDGLGWGVGRKWAGLPDSLDKFDCEERLAMGQELKRSWLKGGMIKWFKAGDTCRLWLLFGATHSLFFSSHARWLPLLQEAQVGGWTVVLTPPSSWASSLMLNPHLEWRGEAAYLDFRPGFLPGPGSQTGETSIIVLGKNKNACSRLFNPIAETH